MLTVGKDEREVERKLGAGQYSCPLCGGRLAPWSHARPRIVFGEGALRWRLSPAAGPVRAVPGDSCAAAGQRAGQAPG